MNENLACPLKYQVNDSTLYGIRVFCLIFSKKPFFYQKLRKSGNFQLFISSKNTKIGLENCFNDIILLLYTKKLSKSPKLYQSQRIAKQVLSPLLTTVQFCLLKTQSNLLVHLFPLLVLFLLWQLSYHSKNSHEFGKLFKLDSKQRH